MKHITISIIFIALLLSGCGDDNAYDGVNGLNSSSTSDDTSQSIQTIYKQIQDDANTTYQSSLELISLAEDANNSLGEFKLLRDGTQELIRAYKKVEAVYVAEKLDNAMIDIPVYIETFSAGDELRKESLLVELESILDPQNTTPIENALYKNAHKSLTALIYALYADQKSSLEVFAHLDARRMQAIQIMAQNISVQLKIIHDFYQTDDQFIADTDNALTILLNQLTISSNRLREWRVGDPGGFTQKYDDDADAIRFEYYASLSSLESIRSILDAHESIMNSGLANISEIGNASGEADVIENRIADLLGICDEFSDAIEMDIKDTKIKDLYDGSYALQQDYTALINALNFQQDIIEADGD